MKRPRDPQAPGWRAPTRRAFVGMIAAAAAAIAARGPALPLTVASEQDDSERPRDTWTGTTRWIGHC